MTEENKIRKCVQCGASLPLNSDRCEYCGSVYKSDKPAEKTQEADSNNKGDIISSLGGIGDLLDGLFDFID